MAQTDREDANPLIPEEIATEIIKAAPASSNIMSLARKLPNLSSKTRALPVMSSLPTAYWVNEANSANETEASTFKRTSRAQWDKKILTIQELAVIVPVPEAVLDDAAYDIWGEILPYISEAIGQQFDIAVLAGDGVSIPGFPQGIIPATPAANVIEATNDCYKDIWGVDGLVSRVEDKGFNITAHLAPLKFKGILRSIRQDNGGLIFAPVPQSNTTYSIDGTPIIFDLNGSMNPSEVLDICGDWNTVVWAIRSDMNIKKLDQAMIQDPDTGDVLYNLAQQDMVALRVTFRAGWQIANPVTRLNPVYGSAYPFAILMPAAPEEP